MDSSSLQEDYSPETLAETRGISLEEAMEHIDKCIQYISAQYDMEYDEIYNLMYPSENKSVIIDGKKYPRHFKDADYINRNTDKYIRENLGQTSDLEAFIKVASYLYYNYDGGGLTDNTFDSLNYYLQKRLNRKGRAYEKIGAPPVDRIRTELPLPMPSLNKVYPETRDFNNFLRNSPDAPLYWSVKLDGVSGMIVYENHELQGIYTRGDGLVGGDVTYLKDIIKIPERMPCTEDFIVRGEFILSKKIWNEKYKESGTLGSYANPRSFVSAKLNSGFISQGLQDIEFVAYQVMKLGDRPILKPSKVSRILRSQGFNVVTHSLFEDPTVFDVARTYLHQRSTNEYTIDGLVLQYDIERPAPDGTLTNPSDIIAFKMRLEEQIRDTKVINIDWGISRYGRYTPVVEFENVYVDGARVHRATAHNAAHIRDWHMGPGTQIQVVRAGDVIPQVHNVNVDDNIPIQYPSDDFEWHWEQNDIILNEIDTNRFVQIKRMEHFFTTLGIPGIGEKTLEKFWDKGFKLVQDVTNMSVADMTEIKGIGQKTAVKHYENIHGIIRKTRFDRFMYAATVFKSGLGPRVVNTLINIDPDIIDYDTPKLQKFFAGRKIKGLGPKTIDKVVTGIPMFKLWLYSINEKDVEEAIRYNKQHVEDMKKNGYNHRIQGKIFILSGFMGMHDYDLEDFIIDNQGMISAQVTSSTETIIVKNINLAINSPKITKALELNQTAGLATNEHKISILTINEFYERYRE
jgi:DNA ligase (NAD+)